MGDGSFSVGQTVLVSEPYGRDGRPREYTVSRVGRSLVYVMRYGSEWAFHQDSGAERRGPNAGGVGAHLYTVEQWADKERRRAVIAALRERGVAPTGYSDFRQKTGTLERLIAVLDDEGEN